MSQVVEYVELAPRTGGFVRVRAGQSVRVIDLDGGQVADLYAWSSAGDGEHFSAQHTRAITDRLFPQVGEALYTDRRRAILTLVRDDSPGVHDMLIASCDPQRYELLGAATGHASCSENFRDAMQAAGFPRPSWTPQAANLFMAIPVAADGSLTWDPATSKPGDSVTFRAEMDCVVVVSACPQDIVPINNLNPTRIGLEVLTQEPSA